jgi:hypothetical protein
VPIAVLVTAPLRPPLSFDSSSTLLVQIADDGRLGRLLPLYFVLAAASTALGWRALRGDTLRALPRRIALPAAAFFAFACCSLLWADDVEAGTNLLLFFTLPFAALVATVARAEFPPGAPRALAAVAIALASVFAAVGLWQAATHKLFFYAPNLAASNANTEYFRVTSLFGDPSLYGRHVVLGIGVALTLLATRRWHTWPLIALVGVMCRPALLLLAVEHDRAARHDACAGGRDGRRAHPACRRAARRRRLRGRGRLRGRAGGGRQVLEQDHQ